ncbi:MAG: hypothetical protein K8T90_22185 [Planctomycetes bacterium]|nr:hypothetical protein [Planctomycetota bacterium]
MTPSRGTAAFAIAALVALAAALIPTSCAAARSVSGDANDPGARSGVTGDDYMSAGDFDRASVVFEQDAALRPGDSAAAEKVRTAKRLAAQGHAELAAAAYDRNELERAAFELEVAERFDRDADPVRRVRTAIGPKLRSVRGLTDEKARAKELVSSDPQAAAEALADLRRRAPYDPEIAELLLLATRRAGADAAAARAEAAWGAGVRRRAVEHLAVAETGGAPTPRAAALRRRMESDLVAESANSELPALRDAFSLARDAGLSPAATDTIRDRLVDLLLREARKLETAGRIATAALFELEAATTGARVDTRNLDRARGERAVVLHVLPFDDATGGGVDGLRLARAVRDRVALEAADGTAALRTTADAPPAGALGFPHLLVTGVATAQRITAGRAGREMRNVRYVAGTRDAANPATSKLNDQLTAARARLARARDASAAAETSLRHLKSLGFGTGPGGLVGSEGDVAYRTRIASAEAALENARRSEKNAASEEFDVRQRILETPATVSEAEWAERPIEVTTMIKTAEISARVKVMDGATTMLDEQVTGSEVHRETVSSGFAEGGIPADADDTPDDAVMSAKAADQLAQALAGKLRAVAELAARRLLEDARAAERRNDPAAAAEGYAGYLLSTSDTATPQRADAARALHEILGAPPALRTGYSPEIRR